MTRRPLPANHAVQGIALFRDEGAHVHEAEDAAFQALSLASTLAQAVDGGAAGEAGVRMEDEDGVLAFVFEEWE